MRVWPALALVVALTVGCGQPPATHVAREPKGSPSASPESQPQPQLHLSFDDLVAALPLASELFPWRVQIRCLTIKATCGHFLAGRGALLTADGETSQEVDEDLMIAALRWPTSDDAHEAVASLRRGYQDRTGRFRTQAHPTSPTSYTMGMTGHGDLTKLEVGAWTGWTHTARYRLTHLDGRTTKTSDDVEIVLTRDRYTVHVRVTRWLPVRTGEPSRQIAEEQLTRLIGALEQSEPEVSGP